MYRFDPKFAIGEFVYHKTPESDKGVIVDISFNALSKNIQYFISFGWRGEESVWCQENEICKDKTF